MKKELLDSPIHCLMLYEKISLRAKLEERRFFNYLDDTCRELIALYPYTVMTNSDSVYTPADDLSDLILIRGIFAPAIVDNILYLAGAGDVYKTEFLRKAEAAAKRRKMRESNIMKRCGW